MRIFRFLFRRVFRSAETKSKSPIVPRNFDDPKASVVSEGGLLEVKVKWIVDGDTVIVTRANTDIKIRLYGIDCPEGDQPWGGRAKSGLFKQIATRTVYLETYGLDQYGRTLATIYVNDGSGLKNVNEEMVKKGHAWVMWMYCDALSRERKRRLSDLEQWARTKPVGLWKQANPIPPWQWRGRRPA